MDYVIKCGANYIGCDSNGKYIEYNGIANATKGIKERQIDMPE